MTRTQPRASKQKPNQVKKNNFFTSYNPSLTCINTLIKKHSDDNLKTLFPTKHLMLSIGEIKILRRC